MDAIKKKMQAMKLEKDNAMDRADACEQQAKDANLRAERVSSSFKQIIAFGAHLKGPILSSRPRDHAFSPKKMASFVGTKL